MGMYTEIYICSELKEETPEEILSVIKWLFGKDKCLPVPKELIIPDHEFFKCDRWVMIGSSASYYHIPYATSDLRKDESSNNWYLVSRSDLKNYDDEIRKFFDWIMPYLDRYEGQLIGYSRYEESDEPQLYFKKGK